MDVNGKWKWIYDRHVLVKRNNKSIIQGIASDITDFKDAERTVARNEKQLRSLFESMTDAVLILDRSGLLLDVAPTKREFLTRAREELVGTRLSDLFPSDDLTRTIVAIADALASERVVSIDFQLLINGCPHWCYVRLSELSIVWFLCFERFISVW